MTLNILALLRRSQAAGTGLSLKPRSPPTASPGQFRSRLYPVTGITLTQAVQATKVHAEWKLISVARARRNQYRPQPSPSLERGGKSRRRQTFMDAEL